MSTLVDTILAMFLYVMMMWVPAQMLLGRVAGWSDLAKHYHAYGPAPAKRQWVISGVVGALHYRNTLVIAIHADGLYVAQFPLFRPGHPPLFIPWDAIYSAHQEPDNQRTITLTIDTDQSIGITLPSSVLTEALPYLPLLQPDTPQFDYGWGLLAVLLGLGSVGALWAWIVLFSGWF